MLKSIIACSAVLTAFSACTFADPIALYGGGNWIDDFYDFDLYGYISAGGTNGTDTAFFWVQNEDSALYQGFFQFSTLGFYGAALWGATIDGMSVGWIGNANAPVGFINVSLYGGNGSLSIYDSNRNELASVSLVGYINVTSAYMYPDEICQTLPADSPCHIDSYGNFNVDPTPEPATVLSIGLSLIFIVLLILKGRSI